MTTTAPAPTPAVNMVNTDRTATPAERAAAIGPAIAEHAARHDTEGTFVTEAYDALRDAGLLKAAVPTELGGDGATVAELTALQRELAHHCGSTALASSMHQHVVAFTAWRYRRGLPGAEATLRRVADEGILLVSTGGGDYTHPRGEAVKVDGGYRVSGPQALRQPVRQRHRDVDDVRLRRPGPGAPGAQRRGPDRRRGRPGRRQLGHARHARHREQRHRGRGRLRARRAGARQPPLRRGRPAAAGDLAGRLPDHLRCLPRHRRGGVRRRARRGRAQGREPARAAPARPDEAPAPGRLVGARRCARHVSARTT